jgi:three-Cys-motif partner protein
LEIDEDVGDVFARSALVPSFSFVDPFGYKGITLRLLKGMLKDWGCDLILFFSYARINAAIDNEIFEDHIVALFGEDRLRELRSRLKGKRPWEREALILETFSRVLHDMGFKYVLPFTFRRRGQDRTSHHLIFVTKHPLGYGVMKEIMAGESSEFDQGVPSLAYSQSMSESETPFRRSDAYDEADI